MNGPTIGALFAGYGGLEMAIATAIPGAHPIWVAEHEPATKTNPRPTQAAARILAHRVPDAPNLGDITTVEWAGVPPVDILAGGFPCTDVSLAGRRAGLAEGTRSGLWLHMARAIDALRPALVVIENVRGLLSATACSDVEPCPWCLGEAGDGEPALRALGAVLGDLADLGYDAAWYGLRAADVGAPHGRFRVFIVAWPAADADGVGPARGRGARGRWPRPADAGRGAAPDPGHDARPEDHPHGDAATGGDRSAADADRDAVRDQSEPVTGRGRAAIAGPVDVQAAADARHDGREGRPEPDGETLARLDGEPRGHTDGRPVPTAEWGAYAAAVARWERVLGRPAPAPTEQGRTGPRLSPRFVEWMMGLPDGHVTDVPGLTRTDQLKALGNGVVPQQGAAALRVLLGHVGGAR